jgi:Ca2+-binding RTX toxin-like protein
MLTKLTSVALAALALCAGSAMAGTGDLAANPPTCEGKPVTLLGTPGDDILVGTPFRDIVLAGDGDDVVAGLGGSDIVCGGPDDDTILGGTGNDILYGGPGDDSLRGAGGHDWLNGQAGDDDLRGGALQDTHRGESGNDVLDAVAGDTGAVDHVFGGSGNDDLSTDDGVANDLGSGGANVDTCARDAADAVVSCELGAVAVALGLTA